MDQNQIRVKGGRLARGYDGRKNSELGISTMATVRREERDQKIASS